MSFHQKREAPSKPNWKSASKQQKNQSSHPLVRQIASRSIQDADLPTKSLEKIPPGQLRDEATLEYAWTIAERDPERVAGYLDQLPANNGTQNLIKKIEQAGRKESSPAR